MTFCINVITRKKIYSVANFKEIQKLEVTLVSIGEEYL